LDRQDHFRLAMTLGEWAYQAKHIPGSIHFATKRDALHSLNTEDEIVVYCSDASCIASAALGQLLERKRRDHSFRNSSLEACRERFHSLA
jgi:hypothetical protein